MRPTPHSGESIELETDDLASIDPASIDPASGDLDPGELEAHLAELRHDGFTVFRGLVPRSRCDAVLDAIASECGIHLDQPATWSLISSEIDQVPLWAHQSQWEIRQLPVMHRIWSAIWGRTDLWADMNSCRVTPPWHEGPGGGGTGGETGGGTGGGRRGHDPSRQPARRADALPIHFDVDPHDSTQRWFPGLVALTDAPIGHGGFRCAPSMFRDPSSWPTEWPTGEHGVEYRPDVEAHEVVEVPLRTGDLLVWDSRLPHGTVRNLGSSPRAAFYLQLHPPGNEQQRAERLADLRDGRSPPWWRWKPGHDRLDPQEPQLSELGRRLLGSDPWPSPT